VGRSWVRIYLIYMAQKLGLCPFFLGALHGPHVTQCGLVRRLPSCHANSYQVASLQPFGHNKYGPKIGEGDVPRGAELGPHLPHLARAEAYSYLHTKWQLIHPAVWPQ